MIASGGSSLGYALGASVGAYLGGIVANKEYDLIAAVVGDGTYLFGVPASSYWLAKRYNTVSVAPTGIAHTCIRLRARFSHSSL